MYFVISESAAFVRFLIAFLLFNFLGFSTAVYNPEFHEKLHVHEVHEHHHEYLHDHSGESLSDDHSESNSDQESQHSDEGCHTCYVHTHIASHVATALKLGTETSPSLGAIENLQQETLFFVPSEIFSSRAPPAF